MSEARDAVMCAWLGIPPEQWERTGEEQRDHVRKSYGLSAQRCLDTVARTLTDDLINGISAHVVVRGLGGTRTVNADTVERVVRRIAWDGV